jgi:hypothetical protein
VPELGRFTKIKLYALEIVELILFLALLATILIAGLHYLGWV